MKEIFLLVLIGLLQVRCVYSLIQLVTYPNYKKFSKRDWILWSIVGIGSYFATLGLLMYFEYVILKGMK